MTRRERITALCAHLQADGIDLFVLPRADAHHVEWLRPSANLVERLSGFDGSYASIVVDAAGAALLTSAIYGEAAELQLGDDLAVIDESVCNLDAWLAARLAPGVTLAVDPWLHTDVALRHILGLVTRAGATLRVCVTNPVDPLLKPLPALPVAAFAHPLRHAGQPAAEKLAAVAGQARRDGVAAYLLSAPDSICWLLNIRGGDVFAAPLVYAFALVKADETAVLFIDPAKVTPALVAHLGSAITLRPYAAIGDVFAGPEIPSVGVDFAATAHAFVRLAEDAGIAVVDRADPCQAPKAAKNAVELAGARACHLRDGVAQVRFWSWFADRQARGIPPTELEAQDRIDGLRAEGALFRGVSFQTISAARSHGSMGHYHSGPATNVPADGDGFYLLDSGGQYLDGTTDVTRTVAVGSPPALFRRRYTQAMRGLIAASTMRFPPGTRGYAIDAVARRPLWDAGADYPHATGHGVGSYLGVHEGPIRLRTKPDPAPLALGMIVSIEPGFYAVGAFGLRHENLVAVVESLPGSDGGEPRWCFETLTLCPFDTAPLLLDEMAPGEIAWLDGYHERVRQMLSPLVDGETGAWLHRSTRPIARR